MDHAHLRVPKKRNPNHPGRRALIPVPVVGLSPSEPYTPRAGRADLRIGQRVLVLRESLGLTQGELGARCTPPMTAQGVSRLERRGAAREVLVQRVAQALGVPVERLLQDAPLHDLARQILAHPRPEDGPEVVLWDAAQAVASRGEVGIEGGQMEEGEARP